MHKVPPEQRFSSRQLTRDLQEKGIAASYFKTTDAVLNGLLDETHPGDVVLFMSNGGFDNIPKRFLNALENTPCLSRNHDY